MIKYHILEWKGEFMPMRKSSDPLFTAIDPIILPVRSTVRHNDTDYMIVSYHKESDSMDIECRVTDLQTGAYLIGKGAL